MRNKELKKLSLKRLFLFCLLAVAVINTVGRVEIKRDLLPGFLCLVWRQHEETEHLSTVSQVFYLFVSHQI